MRYLRTRTPLLALPLFLFALTAGCADPAADAPQAVVEEAAPEPIETAAMQSEGATYTLTADSKIGFVGSKVTGSHEGGFEAFSGSIGLVESSPDSSTVEIEIDTTSLWSDNERLTGHLKSADFFEVETYPTATFASTSIEPAAEGGYLITGNLDLHGVTKQISFPATIEVGESQVRASAEFAIKRFDFDIVYPGKAEDLIRDDVLVKFDLVAEPSA